MGPNVQKGTLSRKMILNECSLSITFHFVQEVNKIWYPRRTIINLLGHQISLTSCTKWQNDE